MGLRGMRVRKSPLVRVLYAEATRPFPVNAKGAGPQTTSQTYHVYQSLYTAILQCAGIIEFTVTPSCLYSTCLFSG